MQILVFFVTARVTQYMAMLFNEMGMPVLDIHSRKSQAQRTRTSAEFRAGRNVIMFTSDVTARGTFPTHFPQTWSINHIYCRHGLP